MDCISNALREGAADVQMLDVYPELPPSGRDPRHAVAAAAEAHADAPTRSTRAASAAGPRRSPRSSAATASVAGVEARQVDGHVVARPAAGARQRVRAGGRPRPGRDRLHRTRARGPRRGARRRPRRARQREGAPSTATSVDGVFACGDARIGQSLVVTAIAEGRRCARVVDRHLGGTGVALPVRPRTRSSPTRTTTRTRCATRRRPPGPSPSATPSGPVRATLPSFGLGLWWGCPRGLSPILVCVLGSAAALGLRPVPGAFAAVGRSRGQTGGAPPGRFARCACARKRKIVATRGSNVTALAPNRWVPSPSRGVGRKAVPTFEATGAPNPAPSRCTGTDVCLRGWRRFCV